MAGSLISFFNMVAVASKMGVEPIVIIPDNTLHHNNFDDHISAYKYYELPIVTSVKRVFPWGHFRLSYRWLKKYFTINSLKKKSFDAIKKIVEAEKPDIIHTNTGVVQEGYLVAKTLNIPHVWHLREYQDSDFMFSFYPSKEVVYKQFSESYTISITRDIQCHFNLVQNPKACTIYNGILSENSAIDKVSKKNYFLSASQLGSAKCIDETITAFSKFWQSHKDYMLYIAGKGALEVKLKSLANSYGDVSKNILFLGFRTDVSSLMAEARALIVASRNEGFGRMTAEAAFNKCIVIGRNTAGTKEILDYIGGCPYDGTIDDLVAKMNEVVDMEDEEYFAIAEKAQRKALEAYTIESNAKNIYNLYCNILSE